MRSAGGPHGRALNHLRVKRQSDPEVNIRCVRYLGVPSAQGERQVAAKECGGLIDEEFAREQSGQREAPLAGGRYHVSPCVHAFDVAEHQKRSLQLYGDGHTKPVTAANVLDLTYHSRGLDQATRSALRSFCRDSLGEDTYARYLGRYDAEAEAEAEPGAAALPTRPADGTL